MTYYHSRVKKSQDMQNNTNIGALGSHSLFMKKFERRLKKDEADERPAETEEPEKIFGPELYRFIIENSHIGFLLIDDTYHVIYVNPEIERITGYSRTEAIGVDFREFLADEGKKLVSERYLERQEGGQRLPRTYEVVIHRKDGRLMTVEINVAVKKAPGEPAISVVQVFGVSERQRFASELAESNKKYRDLFNNVFDLIYIHDLDGNIVETNAHYIAEMGGSRDNIINRNIRDFIPETRRPQFDAYLERIVENGKDEGVLTVELPDGQKRYLEYKNSLIPSNGKPHRIRGSARDITDKRRAEKNLLKMHDALEEKVKERTQALEEANVAMKVLLKKRDADRFDLGEQMIYNIREIISPYIERLKQTSSRDMQKVLIEIIEQNLEDIASPFMRDLSKTLHKLTPSEIQIINLIKHNKTTKEISDLLNISYRTVDTHRANIRKKLGIKNQKINLKSFLLSIGQTEH